MHLFVNSTHFALNFKSTLVNNTHFAINFKSAFKLLLSIGYLLIFVSNKYQGPQFLSLINLALSMDK